MIDGGPVRVAGHTRLQSPISTSNFRTSSKLFNYCGARPINQFTKLLCPRTAGVTNSHIRHRSCYNNLYHIGHTVVEQAKGELIESSIIPILTCLNYV